MKLNMKKSEDRIPLLGHGWDDGLNYFPAPPLPAPPAPHLNKQKSGEWNIPIKLPIRPEQQLKWFSVIPGLLFYTMTYFCSTMPVTYLPLEMQSRDIGSDATGMILASYMYASAASCLLAPYIYKLRRVKISLLVCACLFMLSSCAFSFIFHIPPQYIQIGAVLIRVIQGISGGLLENFFCSAMLTIYSKKIGMISGVIEMGCDLGILTAPVAGAFLYERYGFVMAQLSACVIMTIIFIWMVCTPDFDTTSNAEGDKGSTGGFFQIFRCMPVMFLMFLPFVTTFAQCMPMSFLSTFISDTYNLSTRYTGFVFLCSGLAYVVITPITGYMSDMSSFDPFVLISLSPVLMVAGCFIMSVSTILRTTITYPQILVGSAIQGFGSGMGNGPIFCALTRTFTALNPTVKDQNAYITSIYLLSFPVGEALGTSVGGLMYESMSLLSIIDILAVLFSVYSVIMLAFTLTYGRKIQRQWKLNTKLSSSHDISPLIREKISNLYRTDSDSSS